MENRLNTLSVAGLLFFGSLYSVENINLGTNQELTRDAVVEVSFPDISYQSLGLLVSLYFQDQTKKTFAAHRSFYQPEYNKDLLLKMIYGYNNPNKIVKRASLQAVFLCHDNKDDVFYEGKQREVQALLESVQKQNIVLYSKVNVISPGDIDTKKFYL